MGDVTRRIKVSNIASHALKTEVEVSSTGAFAGEQTSFIIDGAPTEIVLAQPENSTRYVRIRHHDLLGPGAWSNVLQITFDAPGTDVLRSLSPRQWIINGDFELWFPTNLPASWQRVAGAIIAREPTFYRTNPPAARITRTSAFASVVLRQIYDAGTNIGGQSAVASGWIQRASNQPAGATAWVRLLAYDASGNLLATFDGNAVSNEYQYGQSTTGTITLPSGAQILIFAVAIGTNNTTFLVDDCSLTVAGTERLQNGGFSTWANVYDSIPPFVADLDAVTFLRDPDAFIFRYAVRFSRISSGRVFYQERDFKRDIGGLPMSASIRLKRIAGSGAAAIELVALDQTGNELGSIVSASIATPYYARAAIDGFVLPAGTTRVRLYVRQFGTGTFLADAAAMQFGQVAQEILPVGVPTGTIMLWAFGEETIPVGWHICDGRTVLGITLPDLRDRFPLGVGSTWEPVGTTGGNWQTTVTTDIANAEAWVDGYQLFNQAVAARSHTHTATVNIQPPYLRVYFIMYIGD